MNLDDVDLMTLDDSLKNFGITDYDADDRDILNGAGSLVFAKNVLGDSMMSPALHDVHIALYDVNKTRLNELRRMWQTLVDQIRPNLCWNIRQMLIR